MGTVCALECGSFVGFRIRRKIISSLVICHKLGGILCCVVYYSRSILISPVLGGVIYVDGKPLMVKQNKYWNS
jgi:hypothetical protein